MALSRLASAGIFLFFFGCSKSETPVATPSAAAVSNDQAVAAMKEANAPPPNPPETVDGDSVDRMEAAIIVRKATTLGNPDQVESCVTLFDKNNRAVAVEGQFSVTTELPMSAGMYVYAPMYTADPRPIYSSALGVCPAAGEIWPDKQILLRGKTATISVEFVSTTGKKVSATASRSF